MKIKILLSFLLVMMGQSLFANNQNWMSQIPNDRVFNQLIIPGTHDSGTYHIHPQSKFSLSPDDPLPLWFETISNILPISIVRPIVAGWAKTQPDSILTQLNNGARYLDLRICYFKSHFYLCHALISVRLKKVLRQIQSFATQHPQEIILVDINHVYNVNTPDIETQLVALIQRYLSNNAIPNHYLLTDTIGTLRQSGRNVIIFMDPRESIANTFWPESNIDSPWPNAATPTALKNILDIEMALRDKTYTSATGLFVLQVIQTEDTTTVIDGILNPAQYPSTLAQFEMPINQLLTAWLNGYIATYGPQTMNIVIQDWFTAQSPLVSLAIQYDTETRRRNQPFSLEKTEKIAALRKFARDAKFSVL